MNIMNLVNLINSFISFPYNNTMNKRKAMEQLQSMANQPENNLEKLISQELLKQDDLIEFISDAKEF